ncbi:MAG TPA: DJ-1/PfpI family protein [Egibacteraceae bacterium]|nr:DJ-1/PfpI family protein [Egibacteraceae bacterium]
MTTRIGFVLFDGAEELDWVGPWEVLASWSRLCPDDDVQVCTLAPRDGPVRCANGMRVLADHTWEDAPPLDVLVYPGGPGVAEQLGDEAVRAFVRGVAAQGALMTSVCTGSLMYADAGLLDGRPATSYWASLNDLARLGTGVQVRADERFVDDGAVITAAGVSAGIDMALHLVARLHSPERARQLRRHIQYDPAPPV